MAILSFDGGDGDCQYEYSLCVLLTRARASMGCETIGLSGARTAGMVRGLHDHGWSHENVTCPPPGASVLAKAGWAVDHVARAGRIPRHQSGQWVRSHSNTSLCTGVIYVIASTVKITLWVEGTFSQRGVARKDVDLSHVLA